MCVQSKMSEDWANRGPENNGKPDKHGVRHNKTPKRNTTDAKAPANVLKSVQIGDWYRNV